MPAGLFESIATLLDHNKHVDGVDYRQAIFIFLTNAGGKQILHALMDKMENGTYRDSTKLEDFEFIAEWAAYNIGGLREASIIKQGLIDIFLPFLPLQRSHIESCVRTEYKKINYQPHEQSIT